MQIVSLHLPLLYHQIQVFNSSGNRHFLFWQTVQGGCCNLRRMLTHGVSWCSLTTETYILISFFILSYISCPVIGIGEIIWAVNCGGDEHTDIHGINYEADSLDVGFASDYGKTLQIRGAPNPDSILYQTERYHLSTFSYDMPAWKDGEYVLVMKFSEVWFTSSNQKVA